MSSIRVSTISGVWCGVGANLNFSWPIGTGDFVGVRFFRNSNIEKNKVSESIGKVSESIGKVSESIGKVSEQEKIILNYVVNGKTNWEIAKILNVSESSIKFHLKNIFKKTHSNNRSHLVSIALKYNVVDFVDFDFDLISIGY